MFGGGGCRRTVSAVSVRCVVYLVIKSNRKGLREAKVGNFRGKSHIFHTVFFAYLSYSHLRFMWHRVKKKENSLLYIQANLKITKYVLG